MHSILTLHYTQPSRYNWMLQFYLRAAGIELSWIGTGRFIMTFDYSDNEFDELITCFIEAATEMQNAAWWWSSPQLTNKKIKRQFLRDMLVAKFPLLNKVLPEVLITKNSNLLNKLENSSTNNKIEKVG